MHGKLSLFNYMNENEANGIRIYVHIMLYVEDSSYRITVWNWLYQMKQPLCKASHFNLAITICFIQKVNKILQGKQCWYLCHMTFSVCMFLFILVRFLRFTNHIYAIEPNGNYWKWIIEVFPLKSERVCLQ